jgi:DNA-binding response OmpR family regulator
MKKVLLIEDEKGIMDILDTLAKSIDEDVQVERAYDGLTGREKLQKTKYDLIVMDLSLPKLHGNNLMRQLGLNTADKVLIFSGMIDQNALAEGMNSHVTNFISKPAPIAKICNKMKSML